MSKRMRGGFCSWLLVSGLAFGAPARAQSVYNQVSPSPVPVGAAVSSWKQRTASSPYGVVPTPPRPPAPPRTSPEGKTGETRAAATGVVVPTSWRDLTGPEIHAVTLRRPTPAVPGPFPLTSPNGQPGQPPGPPQPIPGTVVQGPSLGLQPLPMTDGPSTLPPPSTATEPRQPVTQEEHSFPLEPIPEGPPIDAVEEPFPTNRFWLGVDYLLWRVPRNPLAVPLLTSGLPTNGDTPPATVGSAGTTILFDNGSYHDGNFKGYRLFGGWWLTADHLFGVEASYFSTESDGLDFFVPSTFSITNVTARPIVNAATGRNTVVIVNYPLAFQGDVQILGGSSLRNFDSPLIGKLWQDEKWDADLLVGFRYTQLQEGLEIQQSSLVLQGGAAFFLGNPVAVGSTVVVSDRFQTDNEFFGGQIGCRVEHRIGCAFFSVTGKVALGEVYQSLDIAGTSILIPTIGPPQSVPAGVLALASNSGRFETRTFSVLPEFGFRIGADLGKCLRIYAGYDLLVFNNVLRPGNQVSNVVNITQIPTASRFGALVGPPVPQVPLKESTLFIQGLNVGMEWRF